VETLLGRAAVLSVGGDLDPDALTESTDGSDVPVGLTVQGDPEAVEEVLDKLRAQLPPDQAELIGSDSNGDTVAIGPSSDYRSALLAEGGTLGDSAAFRDVIGAADRAGVLLYVDFDAGDNWLVALVQDDQELADNLEPLSALGLTAWLDGDVSHSVLRLTTD
jgi:hypothetical protein